MEQFQINRKISQYYLVYWTILAILIPLQVWIFS